MLLHGRAGTHCRSHRGRHGRELELTVASRLGVTQVLALSRVCMAL